MIALVSPVKIKTNQTDKSVTIYVRPDAYFTAIFMACLIGLGYLPFSDFKFDYYAYVGLTFVIFLMIYYFISCNQSVCFVKNSCLSVRKGFRRWRIPLSAIKSGYTAYRKVTSQPTRLNTHFIDIELKVNLPDNPKHWIRNGHANIFSYGFHYWGAAQNTLWDQINQILNDNNIPVKSK